MRKIIALLVPLILGTSKVFAGWQSGGGGPPPAASESFEPDFSVTVGRPLRPVQPLRPTQPLRPVRPVYNIELTDEEMAQKLAEALSNPIKPNPIQIDVNGRPTVFRPKTLDFNARKLILTAPNGEDVTLWKTEVETK
ncbi:MAG: hypothetical protein EOP04_01860 [Proteobacteria bacterium]|nr:MAG: hypothetical protein EOP04_01860 [Pseudomonadota bacterium]